MKTTQISQDQLENSISRTYALKKKTLNESTDNL